MKTSPKEVKNKEKPKVAASKKKSLGSPENKPVNGQETSVKVEDIKAEKSDEETMEEPEETSKFEPSNCLKLQAVGGGQKGFDYNPGKAKYNPLNDAFWKKGEK